MTHRLAFVHSHIHVRRSRGERSDWPVGGIPNWSRCAPRQESADVRNVRVLATSHSALRTACPSNARRTWATCPPREPLLPVAVTAAINPDQVEPLATSGCSLHPFPFEPRPIARGCRPRQRAGTPCQARGPACSGLAAGGLVSSAFYKSLAARFGASRSNSRLCSSICRS
jgi:hypothetical protein